MAALAFIFAETPTSIAKKKDPGECQGPLENVPNGLGVAFA